MSHFISFERGRLSQEAHLYFAYHLEIASMWLSETGRCSEIQDESGSGRCGSRRCDSSVCDVFAVPMKHVDHIF